MDVPLVSHSTMRNPLVPNLIPSDARLGIPRLSALRERSISVGAGETFHHGRVPFSPVRTEGKGERPSSALSLIMPEFQTPRPATPLSPTSQQHLLKLDFEPSAAPSPRPGAKTPVPLNRSNSTSTLYVKTSLQHPDRVGIIYAISKRIFEQVDHNSHMSQEDWDAAVAKVPPVFDEYRYRPPASRVRLCDPASCANLRSCE